MGGAIPRLTALLSSPLVGVQQGCGRGLCACSAWTRPVCDVATGVLSEGIWGCSALVGQVRSGGGTQRAEDCVGGDCESCPGASGWTRDAFRQCRSLHVLGYRVESVVQQAVA